VKVRSDLDFGFIIYLSIVYAPFLTLKVNRVSIEKISVESQRELADMVAKEINQLEKDLTVICSNVPINDKTTLDILCHDGNGQLVILQLNVSEDDIMLLQGIQSLNYVDKFKSFLKATYNKHKINDSEKPRLILIAPSFSDAMRRAVESMQGMRIDLYQWEYLKLGEHKGLRLQSIFTWREEKPTEEKSVEKKRESKPTKKKESPPEPEKEEKPEPPEEEFVFPPPPVEEPAEEKETVKPEKEEPPRRKLKLF
jgi:hypothetical protein